MMKKKMSHLLTRYFLGNYDYDVTAFTDPSLALNYIRDPHFDDLLIILVLE